MSLVGESISIFNPEEFSSDESDTNSVTADVESDVESVADLDGYSEFDSDSKSESDADSADDWQTDDEDELFIRYSENSSDETYQSTTEEADEFTPDFADADNEYVQRFESQYPTTDDMETPDRLFYGANMDPREETSVRKELTCPFCQGTMYSPLRQCNNGHILCNDCVPNSEICNFCGATVGQTRLYSLERIFANMKFSCKFSMYGCNKQTLGVNMKEHQEKCRYKRSNRSNFFMGRRYNNQILL